MRLAVIVLSLIVGHASVAGADCGEERAAVKLGVDAEAEQVATDPVDTTIAALVTLKRPRSVAHRSPLELQAWRVQATITAYKLETDGDFHVVIADSAGHHMIVEIPSPRCVGANRTAPATGAGKPRVVSAWRDQIVSARRALLRLLADRGLSEPGTKLRRVSVPVLVTGIGFFDRVHGQVGVAANGIELHPVLGVEIGGGS